MNTLTAPQVHQRMQEGKPVCLIDVRTPAEFREIHALGAVNIPLHELTKEAVQRQRFNGEPVYVICHKGNRSQTACQKLNEAGLDPVIMLEGGTEAWEQAGCPVKRGKKAVSIERQVRIAAGGLILISVALGILLHPYWLSLSGFVGAGLMFAGITDTCGMAMLLARMPWNRA